MLLFDVTRPAPPPGFFHNCAEPCGADGCVGMAEASARLAATLRECFGDLRGALERAGAVMAAGLREALRAVPSDAWDQYMAVHRGRYHGARKRAKALRRFRRMMATSA